MEFDKLLIGMLIFGFFIAGGLILVNDAVEKGNIDTETDNSSNALGRINKSMQDTYLVGHQWKSDLEGTDVTIDTAENNLFRNAFLTIKKIWSSVDVIASIFVELETLLGMPPLVKVLINSIMIIGIGATLIFLMFRFQPR